MKGKPAIYRPVQRGFNPDAAYFPRTFLLYYNPILTSPKVSHVLLPKLVSRGKMCRKKVQTLGLEPAVRTWSGQKKHNNH
jgi:hypothetical protein